MHRSFSCSLQTVHIGTGTLQQRLRAVILAQHRHQQMGWFDVGVVVANSQGLRLRQGFLEFGGQFVKTHESSGSEK